jgi:hypothetical protein
MKRLAMLVGMTMAGALGAQLVGAPAPASTPSLTITGVVQGVAYNEFRLPDTGRAMAFWGTGQTNLAGPTVVTGSQTAPGFIRNGRCRGSLNLYTSQGVMTVELASPGPVPGFSSCPADAQWRFVAGTGAYAHWAGEGSVNISVSELTHDADSPKTFTMTFQGRRPGGLGYPPSFSRRLRAAAASRSA